MKENQYQSRTEGLYGGKPSHLATATQDLARITSELMEASGEMAARLQLVLTQEEPMETKDEKLCELVVPAAAAIREQQARLESVLATLRDLISRLRV